MSLLKTYTEKISSIEETYDPNKFTKEEIYGRLSAFEMKKFGKSKKKSESSFKASKEDPEDERSTEMEANFLRKLKKGTTKYKGMLRIKCFGCGNIGHIAARYSKKRSRQNFRECKGKSNKTACYVKDDDGI